MNRSRIFAAVVLCLLAAAIIIAAPASHLPKTNTRAALMTYVGDAAAIVQKSGPSCATFASPEWRGGDYYVFVLGPDDKLVCHPRPDMIGKDSGEITNKSGDKVGDKIVAMGKGSNKGWVEYLWAKSGKTDEELKSTYVMGITGADNKHYIVGAGAWDLTK
ncbi:MAG: cache domain-containing protein [Thermoanaerobaculia bacterium]